MTLFFFSESDAILHIMHSKDKKMAASDTNNVICCSVVLLSHRGIVGITQY